MAKSTKRRIVIDASVARSASQSDDAHSSRGGSCREFLFRVLKDCYRIAMTSDVLSEWKKHESSYARAWRATMVAKKKLCVEEVSDNSSLRGRILETASDEKSEGDIEKDLRLIEAALATDRCVMSLDATARTLFSNSAATVPELADIDWANPELELPAILEWMQAGAPHGSFALG